MPVPAITGGQLSITYYARSVGIVYSVEASPDMKTWSPTGVTLSALDANGYRKASASMNGPSRFLRLVANH